MSTSPARTRQRTPRAPALSAARIANFRKRILQFYKKEGRAFPWRETDDSYALTVSELMLQQTQTKRVLEYYPRFLKKFPSFAALAEAPLAEVLQACGVHDARERAQSKACYARRFNDDPVVCE